MRQKLLSFIAIVLASIVIHGCQIYDEVNARTATLEQYRKAASLAFAKQQHELAVNNYLLVIEEYERTGRKSSTSYGNLSKVYFTQGRYHEAINAENICYQRRRHEMQIHEVFWHYGYLAEIYQAQGQYDEARQAVQWLIDNSDKQLKAAEQTRDNVDLINARGLKLWTAYPTIANFYSEVGENEKAIQHMREHVDYLEIKKSTL